jgi:hypothetical protein
MRAIGQADFDIIAGVAPIVSALEQVDARYALTGSLAAVAHGVGRAVGEVDLVVDLTQPQAHDLAELLRSRYALDESRIVEALQARASFPLVELSMLLKVDIVLPRDRALDRDALERARPTPITLDLPPIPLITPEDLILFKLERAAAIWPRRGDDWHDLQFLLKFRRDLDHGYLDTQTAALGWTKGLATARAKAATEPLALDLPLATEQKMLDLTWKQQRTPLANVEGARRDRIAGVAFERQRDRQRDRTSDDLSLALHALKWRSWNCDDPALSEHLVDMVAARARLEGADAARR